MTGGNRADGDPVRAILIAGPTASGKSALALDLAARLDGVVVNADSMQVYRELRILTARPGPADEARVPHRLYGFVSAADAFSVGRWLDAARAALDAIWADGRLPVVVGGTGLYFRALTHGLAEIPPVPEALRAETEARFAGLGEEAFRAELAVGDPAAAARIAPGDRQRLVRAAEVLAATGTALSDWQARTDPALAPGTWRAAALDPPRDALYARCGARLEAMIGDGALGEVAALSARNLDADLPAMKAVGYRELAAHLRGEIPLAQAISDAQRETRRYAKRQVTWMRGQMADWPRIDAISPEDQWGQFLALSPALTP
jgi:tRNA dimethylallyltransferase